MNNLSKKIVIRFLSVKILTGIRYTALARKFFLNYFTLWQVAWEKKFGLDGKNIEDRNQCE